MKQLRITGKAPRYCIYDNDTWTVYEVVDGVATPVSARDSSLVAGKRTLDITTWCDSERGGRYGGTFTTNRGEQCVDIFFLPAKPRRVPAFLWRWYCRITRRSFYTTYLKAWDNTQEGGEDD